MPPSASSFVTKAAARLLRAWFAATAWLPRPGGDRDERPTWTPSRLDEWFRRDPTGMH